MAHHSVWLNLQQRPLIVLCMSTVSHEVYFLWVEQYSELKIWNPFSSQDGIGMKLTEESGFSLDTFIFHGNNCTYLDLILS